MASAAEKRMLTAPNSKLTKVDLAVSVQLRGIPQNADQTKKQILRKESAWETLDLETRQRLYSLLPPPVNEDMPHNLNVNPLQSQFGKGIENELRKWQDDLKDGRESKKWRDEAMQAGRDRASGAFDVAQTEGRDERERGENGNTV